MQFADNLYFNSAAGFAGEETAYFTVDP